MQNQHNGLLKDVSRETLERLEVLQDLTLKWTKKINLIAPMSSKDLWARHIVDSAQLWEYRPGTCKSWVDLGSGGGFPGLVLAAVSNDMGGPEFTLIESDQRKCVFLRQAAREMGISVTVLNSRIESAGIKAADVISARALAPLRDLFKIAEQFTESSTVFILPKGKTSSAELEAAAKKWSFHVDQHQSKTESDARILVFQDVKRRN